MGGKLQCYNTICARVHTTLNYQNVVHISYTAVTLNECYLQTSTKFSSTLSTKTLLQLYRNIFVFLIRI